MRIKIGEKVFFEKLGHIYSGNIEKELVNTYILVVDTKDQQFNEMYHGRIAVSKKECSFGWTDETQLESKVGILS